MSSEMRELIAKWRDTADQCEERGLEACSIGLTVAANKADARADELRGCANELEALLARAEAGADGVEPFGWWIECHGTDGDFGQFVTDRAFVELLRSHGVVERETALFTHPQDASGDAVDWKWQYRFQTVMRFMDNGATREAAERAALIDIAALESAAMQAKEAK